MINIEELYDNPKKIQKDLAERAKEQRQSRHCSREKMAQQTGVSYASIRRFETTGEISLGSFVKIAVNLGFSNEINNLFTRKYYSSIQEIIDEESRKY